MANQTKKSKEGSRKEKDRNVWKTNIETGIFKEHTCFSENVVKIINTEQNYLRKTKKKT